MNNGLIITIFVVGLTGLLAGLAYLAYSETNTDYHNDDLEDEDIHNEYF
jgi:hypothetical protein